MAGGGGCNVVVWQRGRGRASGGSRGHLPLLPGIEIRNWLESRGIRIHWDGGGHAVLGLCQPVLGARSGGGLPAFCLCLCLENSRLRSGSNGISLCTRGCAGCRMGDGYGISRCARVGDSGCLRFVASMVPRRGRSTASHRRRGNRSGNLRDRVTRLSPCSVRFVASELFLLRSQFVFVHAAAGISGTHLSSSGSTAETFVRLRAWIVF